MIDLTSLIERIEAATEGSRELDLTVHLALFPDSDIANITKYPRSRGLDRREGYSWNIYKFAVLFEKRTADGRCSYSGGYPLPCYSTSIDAALTLLPEGYDWIIGNVNGHYGGTPYACVGSTEQHYAATPVLALLAAILRARQAAQSGQAQTEARG